jgi:hypothetical protein
MRPIGDLMKDMGFNKDAPLETQKAFIRHLISAANAADNTRGVPPREPIAAKPAEPQQLSFDSEILGGPLLKKTP